LSSFAGAARSFELVGFPFDQATVQCFLVCSGVDGLLVGETAGLDQFPLFFVSGDHSEEVLFDLLELALELLGLVVLLSLGLWRFLVGEALGDVKGLLAAEFTVENLEHDFAFLRLEGLIVEGRAQGEDRGGTFGISNGAH